MKISFSFILFCLLSGCTRLKSPLPPIAPPATPTVPSFEKTFGSVSVGRQATMILRYKSMVLVVDPDLVGNSSVLPETDYLLLTDADPRHFAPVVRSSIRPKIKIITSPEEAGTVRNAGFSEVKGLGAGQRMLLKKGEDFVFVSAVQSRSSLTKREVSSFLLEFDNGRNLFISGEIPNADALREFVYTLRDDGKEIYEGFFYRQPGLNEAALAQMISLLQPRIALISQTDMNGLPKFNETLFQEALRNELYEGPYVVLQNGREIPF